MRYDFTCDSDGGCGHTFEVESSMSEISSLQPECPACGNKKHVYREFGSIIVSIPHTLGSLAEKNSRKMSNDHKNHLIAKYNEYRNKPFSGSLPEGAKTFEKDSEGKRIPGTTTSPRKRKKKYD